jgi:hypothetical protein
MLREDKVRRLITTGKRGKRASLWKPWIAIALLSSQKSFKVEWPTRSLYHVMLNTSIGEENVVRSILTFKDVMEPSLR